MNEQTEESGEADFESGAGTGARMAPERLVTRRLVLRRPEMADAHELVPLANNFKIAEQTSRMPHPYGLADAERWIRSVRKQGDKPAASFLITRKGDGAILGAVGYGPLPPENDIEIGYWVAEPHWGNGYATEAAQAAVDHAFATGAVDRLHGSCRVANTASRRVLEKCGFQYVGTGMCQSRVLKGAVPTEDFVLERSIWESLKRWGAG